MNKISALLLSLISCALHAQKPKLVVGLVVDQMSNDYINRFGQQFGEGGFNRLIREGYYFQNANFNYVPTATGPGHASIYSGAGPSMHGIAGNNWYDRAAEKVVYCVDDANAKTIGSESETGKRSPENLYGATVTDMLQLHYNGEPKVIGIALKDRSAILPAGRSGDAAYWWDDKAGRWITSDYYMEKLPEWVDNFSKSNSVESYLKEWNSTVAAERKEQYKAHDKFEEPFVAGGSTSFPYDLKSISKAKGISVLKSTPYGDEYTFDFARAALIAEKLGKDNMTDFLALSFSSTDYVGHRFGPHSEEVEDAYLRFDKELSEFLSFLDQEVGEENYLLFLTSDHGVMPNSAFLKSQKIKSESVDYKAMQAEINAKLQTVYGTEELVKIIMNEQVYFDAAKLTASKIKREEISRKVAEMLMEMPAIQLALSSHDLQQKEFSGFPKNLIQRGYHKDRSGDVCFVLKPFYDELEYGLGAGHGKPYVFDTHVPLIFYGSGTIEPGTDFGNVDITQIAPTLADLLKIQRPPYAVDESLIENLQ